MKKKILLLTLASISLASCAKTNLLYKENAYNSPIFDENYYTEWDGIKDLKIRNQSDGLGFNFNSSNSLKGINKEDVGNYVWDAYEHDSMWGYHNNLDLIEPQFNYGILSKLYDGRVRCDSYYQKSRVQLDKTGYATYFPKSLVEAKFIAFSCRGGSTLPEKTLSKNNITTLKLNIKLSFYIHLSGQSSYDKIVYSLNNVDIETDNSASTSLVSFYLPDPLYLNGAVAMSLEWECADKEKMNRFNFTDDYQDKEKDHLALMLYEVFIGQSTWF